MKMNYPPGLAPLRYKSVGPAHHCEIVWHHVPPFSTAPFLHFFRSDRDAGVMQNRCHSGDMMLATIGSTSMYT
jgi:hypothetical protein